MNTEIEYSAGVCNIGPAEITRRRFVGWSGTVFSLGTAFLLFWFDFPSPWRLLLFFPASLAAAGFLQARMRFCARFGFFGMFDMSKEGNRLRRVEGAESRSADRRKAVKIGGWSMLVGAAVALMAYAIQ